MGKRKEYKQGYFSPNNPKKYTGTHPIVYRSSLELAVMRFFDDKSNFISWGSETVVIPYLKPDGKIHRYYTDFVATVQDNTGTCYKYIIEVKPFKQTIPPTLGKNKKQKTILTEQYNWAVNSAKWTAARAWCDKNNCKFAILTEKDIQKYMI